MSAIIKYLQPPFRLNGLECKSPYIAALMDARACTGRDVNTGEIVDNSKIGNWAGALAYMVLIDHIGTFILKSAEGNSDNNKFIRALKDFTDLPEAHIYALYALRCAFAHQYSLINVGKGRHAALLHHQFNVHRGDGDLIKLPATPWNGNSNKTTDGLITSVSLRKLGDLLEEIHRKLLVLANANLLKAGNELRLIYYPASE